MVGNRTLYHYNDRGLLVETIDPDLTPGDLTNNPRTRSSYDAMGRVVFTTDRFVPGQQTNGTKTTYDGLGRVTKTERFANVQIPVSETSSGSDVWETGTVTTGSLLSTSTTTYDSQGRVASTTSVSGQVTEYGYDAADRQTSMTQKNVEVWNSTLNSGAGGLETVDVTTDYVYDAAGRQTKVTAPQAWVFDPATSTYSQKRAVTRFIYDNLGQVTRTIFDDGTSVQTAYDALNRRSAETDQLGHVTDYQYDAAGNLTKVIQPPVQIDGQGAFVRPEYVYTYDVHGNQSTQKDAETRITSYRYDAQGRRLKRILPDDATTTDVEEVMTYDALGRLKSVKDFAGNVMWNVYDGLGRVDAVFYFAPTVTPNDNGTGAGEKIDYVYDALFRQDQLIHTKDVDGDGTIESVDGDFVRTTDYDYDVESRVIKVDSPEGVVRYGYDPATGRLTSTWTGNAEPALATTRTDYTYDALDRLRTVTALRLNGVNVSLATTYAFDALGIQVRVTLPNGVKSDYAFDALGRLLRLTLDVVAFTLKGWRPLVADGAMDGHSSTVQTARIDPGCRT